MRNLLFSLATLTTLSSTAPAQNEAWVKVASKEKGFTVQMPGNPREFKAEVQPFILQRPNNRCNGQVSTPQSKEVFDSFALAQQDDKAPAQIARTLRMKVVTLCDVPRNNSQPLCTVLAPADWRTESDMKWPLESRVVPFALWARFSAPDGSASVEFFPIPHGALNISPAGTTGSAPKDVLDALGKLAQSARPRIRFKVMEQKAGKVEKTGADKGPVASTQRTAQTGRIRLVYEETGKTFEEEIAGTLHVNSIVGQGFESHQWFVEFPRSIKAVKGNLEELLPVGQAICRSVRATPEFMKALEVGSQVAGNLQKLNMELAQAEAQMWRDANRQVNDAWRKVCAERWASEQKIAEGRRDILGSAHRFESKDREVIAPITYKHLWENGQGEYLLTNDASFRPGPNLKGTWTQLRPK